MKAFLLKRKPKSVQSKTKSKYQEYLREAYNEYCDSDAFEEFPLYGKVYYFHRENTRLDADNLSKPVWDALEGLAYEDDSVIKLRHAGIIDLRKRTWNCLTFHCYRIMLQTVFLIWWVPRIIFCTLSSADFAII